MRQFDAALPGLLALLREDDLLFITADHGNDPTTPSTDHARECVPLLALGAPVQPAPVGRRDDVFGSRRDGRRVARRRISRPWNVVSSRNWLRARMAVDDRLGSASSPATIER